MELESEGEPDSLDEDEEEDEEDNEDPADAEGEQEGDEDVLVVSEENMQDGGWNTIVTGSSCCQKIQTLTPFSRPAGVCCPFPTSCLQNSSQRA